MKRWNGLLDTTLYVKSLLAETTALERAKSFIEYVNFLEKRVTLKLTEINIKPLETLRLHSLRVGDFFVLAEHPSLRSAGDVYLLTNSISSKDIWYTCVNLKFGTCRELEPSTRVYQLINTEFRYEISK